MNAAIEPPHVLCDICMFDAEQHISKRLSALAVLTRPDDKKVSHLLEIQNIICNLLIRRYDYGILIYQGILILYESLPSYETLSFNISYHVIAEFIYYFKEYCRAAEFKNVDRDDVCILFVLVTDP